MRLVWEFGGEGEKRGVREVACVVAFITEGLLELKGEVAVPCEEGSLRLLLELGVDFWASNVYRIVDLQSLVDVRG